MPDGRDWRLSVLYIILTREGKAYPSFLPWCPAIAATTLPVACAWSVRTTGFDDYKTLYATIFLMSSQPPIAVVTGSSSGIGRAIAVVLAADGANVIIHTRANREGAEETAALIRQHGGDATVLVADLSQESSRRQLVESAWQWHSGVDIWINNAGADVLTGEPAGWSFERKLDALFRVDLAATMALSRDAGADESAGPRHDHQHRLGPGRSGYGR